MSLKPNEATPGTSVVISDSGSPFFGVQGVIQEFNPRTKKAYVVFEDTATVGDIDYNGGEFPISSLSYPD